MFCPQCGAENAAASNFCTSCGAPMKTQCAKEAFSNSVATEPLLQPQEGQSAVAQAQTAEVQIQEEKAEEAPAQTEQEPVVATQVVTQPANETQPETTQQVPQFKEVSVPQHRWPRRRWVLCLALCVVLCFALLALALFLFLPRTQTAWLSDGVYTAQASEAVYGWTDTLSVTYKGGKVVEAKYDAFNEAGKLKSATTQEEYDMDILPSAWIPLLNANIVKAGTADAIEAIAGATASSETAKFLMEAIENAAKQGSKELITVTIPPFGNLGTASLPNTAMKAHTDILHAKLLPNAGKITPLENLPSGVMAGYKGEHYGTILYVEQPGFYKQPLLAVVAFDDDGKITGAWFDASQEAEGVGMEVGSSNAFSEQFKGKYNAEKTDMVAGATTSSTAAQKAVDIAAESLRSMSVSHKEETEVSSLTQVQKCHVLASVNNLRLRAEPSIDAEILDNLPTQSYLYILETQGDWIHCVYLGQEGWCASKYVEVQTYPQATMPLPEFLTYKQQILFLRALTLYDSTIWGSSGRDYSQTIYMNDWPYHPSNIFLGDFDRLSANAHYLFDSKLAETYFFENRFLQYNGKLYEQGGDGGCVLGIDWRSHTYTLTNQTDSQIDFTLDGVYDGYTRTLPLSMVKGDDGLWRFTQFASPYNDQM